MTGIYDDMEVLVVYRYIMFVLLQVYTLIEKEDRSVYTVL